MDNEYIEKISKDYVSYMSVLYFLGVEFIEDSSDKRIVKFTIPEFIEFESDAISFGENDTKYDIHNITDRIEMVKDYSWRATNSLTNSTAMEILNAENSEMNSGMNDYFNNFLEEIHKQIRYMFKIRKGERWTKELGEQNAINAIEKFKRNIQSVDDFIEV